jgi:hypothetical protein
MYICMYERATFMKTTHICIRRTTLSHRARSRTKEEQGCQMVYFQTKTQIWVGFGGSCNGRCWSILCTFDLFYIRLVFLWTFVFFVAIWYIFSPFGTLYQEKSGNPEEEYNFLAQNDFLCDKLLPFVFNVLLSVFKFGFLSSATALFKTFSFSIIECHSKLRLRKCF